MIKKKKNPYREKAKIKIVESIENRYKKDLQGHLVEGVKEIARYLG